MAHRSQLGFCSHGALRLVLIVVGVCLIGCIVGPPLYWHLSWNVAAAQASCVQCLCSCPLDAIPSIPLDCDKHDPEMNKEMEKDIIDLLSEELNLQRHVIDDDIERNKASILGVRKTSSHYQKEAEKCNAGMETCEEAREKAEEALIAELKLSALWEKRAREHGWKKQMRA